MAQQNVKKNIEQLLNFVANAPENQEIINMDCNEHCEQMACLAERVARGEDMDTLLPDLQKYMQYWRDCREEFLALVAVLRAEYMDNLPDSSP